MGAVYKARQPRIDRIVALKVLCCPPESHDAFALRFEQEAQLLARLQHPNIVAIFEFGEREEEPGSPPLFYFLMEYVDGTDLASRLRARRDPVPATEALSIIRQIAEALRFAHGKGVLHRDIKPANLLLDSNGTVKVADFGVAKIHSQDGPTRTDITLTGSTMGTPYYIAPELLDGDGVADERADLYSAGVVLYQLLTGNAPAGLLDPPSKRSDLPSHLDALVVGLLEKNPDSRLPSASILLEKTHDAQKRLNRLGRARDHRRLTVLAAAAVVLAGGAALAFSFIPGSPGRIADSPAANLPWAPSSLQPPLPFANADYLAPPGRLVAYGSTRKQALLDLTRAEPHSDFVQVEIVSNGWIALRLNGDTVSSRGDADRTGITRIFPGLYNSFALLDHKGSLELFGYTPSHATPNESTLQAIRSIGLENLYLDRHRVIALLKDRTVRIWGAAYDHHEYIPEWIRIRGPWTRPPDEALRNVVSIGMGFSWDGTITEDGRLWVWGRGGLRLLGRAEPLQGEFREIGLTDSDSVHARLGDGRLLKSALGRKSVAFFEIPGYPGMEFHRSSTLLSQSADGSWHSFDEIPPHRAVLDRVTAWPGTQFAADLENNPGESSPGVVLVIEKDSR